VDGAPGLRRSTGVLTAFWVMFAMVWHSTSHGAIHRPWLRWPAVAACLLLPAIFLWRAPALAADLGRPDVYANRDWFAIAESPQASLEKLRRDVTAGKPLECPRDGKGGWVPCRYQEIYAALEGFRRWNGLPAADLMAVDWRTGDPIRLSTELWNTGYYPKCTRMAWCKAEMEAIGVKIGGL
jgi:hypothetical protein